MKQILLLLIAISSINMIFCQEIPLSIEPYIFESEKGDKVKAEMGTFAVPENRNKSNSKTLQLKFVRFKSTNPNPGPPIVYLAGGPGGSGIRSAQYDRFQLFMSMRAIGDVIAFDQRGTGISEGPIPYEGFWMSDFAKPTTEQSATKVVGSETINAASYFEENGTDLTGYNSNESADDLNDLRIALGVEKISLWGISYGSHLALATLKRHESKIEKIIIAGVEGYDHTVKLPSDQQALLEKIDALIKADPEASKAYPDFLGDMEKLLNVLDEKPQMVTSVHPLAGTDIQVAIGKLDMQMLISWTLRGPESFADLPLMISQMLNGDYSSIKEHAVYTHVGKFQGMAMSMDVASGISKARRERIKKEAASTLLGDAINFPYFQHRAELPSLDLGKDFRAPFYSEIPVLCISGTLDGRTAVNNAIETLEYLPNGKHLIIEGAGHSDPLFLSSPRIEEVMLEFMQGKKIENETIALEPMTFKLPSQEK